MYPEELISWVRLFKAKTWEDIKMLAQIAEELEQPEDYVRSLIEKYAL